MDTAERQTTWTQMVIGLSSYRAVKPSGYQAIRSLGYTLVLGIWNLFVIWYLKFGALTFFVPFVVKIYCRARLGYISYLITPIKIKITQIKNLIKSTKFV